MCLCVRKVHLMFFFSRKFIFYLSYHIVVVKSRIVENL